MSLEDDPAFNFSNPRQFTTIGKRVGCITLLPPASAYSREASGKREDLRQTGLPAINSSFPFKAKSSAVSLYSRPARRINLVNCIPYLSWNSLLCSSVVRLNRSSNMPHNSENMPPTSWSALHAISMFFSAAWMSSDGRKFDLSLRESRFTKLERGTLGVIGPIRRGKNPPFDST